MRLTIRMVERSSLALNGEKKDMKEHSLMLAEGIIFNGGYTKKKWDFQPRKGVYENFMNG